MESPVAWCLIMLYLNATRTFQYYRYRFPTAVSGFGDCGESNTTKASGTCSRVSL